MKKPIQVSIKSESHTPQYKMHKYFARRPYNVFSNLIEHYSEKGDVILDVFCGGGVTVFEGCKLQRNVIGVDLNPLATFITKMQMFNKNISDLILSLENFYNHVFDLYKDSFSIAIGKDKGQIEWVEWAYVVKCPECGSNIILKEENKVKNGIYSCPNQSCMHHSGIARTKCKNSSSIPLRVKYFSENDKKFKVHVFSDREAKEYLNKDNDFKEKLQDCKYPKFNFPLNWDRQIEDKLIEKGIISYSDIFSNKNLYFLSKIFEMILDEKQSNPYVDYLYFVFSSALRYTNKMSRVTENWEGGNPTCMDKHAYWFPNEYIENNPLNVLLDRVKTVLKGCKYSSENLSKNCEEIIEYNFSKEQCNYLLLNTSSEKLDIPDESIDVVITDPPYGSNVQYAELSTVWNAWYQLYAGLDDYIYRSREAVSTRKKGYDGSKSEKDYENILYNIFKECYRVLKNDSYLVFTFNNKNLNVWLAMLKAVARAGFYLPKDGVLFQDFIDNYKNTAHLKYEGNVQGDFIYSFVKTDNYEMQDFRGISIDDIVDLAINNTINDVFSNNSCISSENLYKSVFNNMAASLMDYVIFCNKTGIVDDLSFEEKSIDDHLLKYLIYTEEGWKIK